MEIESKRLMLKEISLEDLKSIHELYSSPEVDKFNTLGIPKDIEATKKLIQPMIEEKTINPRKAYHWKIVLKDTGEFIGLTGLSLSNDKFKLGEIYYEILPRFWKKGYATETAKTVIKSGFDNFQLHKIEAGVATGNIDSIKVLDKLGMTREGLRRKILPIRGEWIDNYHYAIVEDDPRDY
ncbi:GNAT family N-acetyltransferase [Ancylomarina sp. DW003]|nr:GNAT family N-acetyltransferase [Ancylomarina sp. DW003]MDE5423083.1 GNAT family N-acetyltransferase [Ancylomarina sp. DW003]